MTEPQRIQLSRRKGFNLRGASLALNGLPAVNCARPGKWGNPYQAMRVGSYWTVWEDWPMKFYASESAAITQAVALHRGLLLRHDPKESIATLRGHNLACWCALPRPGEPDVCHAATLLWLANK